MLKYNRFWHYWFTLNNQTYDMIAIVMTLAWFFLLGLAIVMDSFALVLIPLVVSVAILSCTKLSDYFYEKQNQQLAKVVEESDDAELKSQVQLYLNRRVVCPNELLSGTKVPSLIQTRLFPKKISSHFLTFQINKNDYQVQELIQRTRNVGKVVKGSLNTLYYKRVQIRDGLSEIAAREMAEIFGYEKLIPDNVVGGVHNLAFIKQLIDEENNDPNRSPQSIAKNTVAVQKALIKFVYIFRNSVLRNRMNLNSSLKLDYFQNFIQDAISGETFLEEELTNNSDRTNPILESICFHSFQENFLLQLLLGSQDGHPGNTLIQLVDGKYKLYTIDSERIMPEDNYNINKFIPFDNDEEEELVRDVFPIRLWLAGLPHAQIPFTKEVMKKFIDNVDIQRLRNYHQSKKLFSSQAVGAQIDRIILIQKVFTQVLRDEKIQITPRDLLLQFVNNHSSYVFLQKSHNLSPLSIFQLLGWIPSGADLYPFLRSDMDDVCIENVKIALYKKHNGEQHNSNLLTGHTYHKVLFNYHVLERKEKETKIDKEGYDRINNFRPTI